MESSRKKLIVEFVHDDSNVECYRVKELNHLKRLKQGLAWLSNCAQVMMHTDFFCNISIGLRVDSYVFPHIILP